MARHEFTKKTKREALARSEMKCEAIGKVYGLDPGKRCNMPLSNGVQFDHIVADALGGDNGLDNCAAVCIKCHKIKTSANDTPKAAKTKRVSDKAKGIKAAKPPIRSPGFPSSPKAAARQPKPLPPRRNLFQEDMQEDHG
ncbi:HNH endonuclease [Allorhizobium ampelinum]|uniref:HNH endonuclease n=1 Tax=Allorhizobium ampelinum TaxID=3025782 RepID=UPI000B3F801F|nr:HNH endonuclease signature motif containing protein [Allorhizobium ampelinum]NTA27452.1 HNH endonuclease [Allorhizobium ampelinum]OVE94508.1 HNH endonuclease [Allorhizobium ampelinum]